MKSALETLNPTRVRLTVEVPFEELKPSLDAAYKKIATQVAIPGFRRGKVPPRLIDQRFGREAVLEEAVNEALPRLYGQAVRENDVAIVGQPEVEVTGLADGQQLTFTAEVDVRPEFELPDYKGLQISVDDVEVSESDVEEQLERLRERFGTLRSVDRPAAEGNFLSLDLEATIDGETVDSVSGLSYEVGSETLLDGLDEVVRGMSAGESTTFTTALAGGERAGEEADVALTVGAVKERDLPALDDDFAQTASEFDTLEELRADVRTRVERMKRLEQGVQARDRTMEALLAAVDVPLPESLVKGEVDNRLHVLNHELEEAGLTKEEYLGDAGQEPEAFDREVEVRARESIKAQFVLDKIATSESLQVTQEELTAHLVRRAAQSKMEPEQFADQVVKAGQVQALVAEVVRGKALATVLEAATVTDASGRPVDLEALREDDPAAQAAGNDALVDEDRSDDDPSDAEPADQLDAEPGPGSVDPSEQPAAEESAGHS